MNLEFERICDINDFLTTQKMYDMGMCACNNCGKITSIDYKFCDKCQQKIIVIL